MLNHSHQRSLLPTIRKFVNYLVRSCDSIVGQLENENADKTKMVVDEELGPASVRALCALLGGHPDFKINFGQHYTFTLR